MKKLRTIKTKYIATNEEYFEAKSLLPQPIVKHIPQWWRKMKGTTHQDAIDVMWMKRTINIKSCPSFIDIYKEGIVLLAPCDIRVSFDDVDDIWTWRSPIEMFPNEPATNLVTFHNDDQMKNYLPPTSKTRVVFKINLPLLVQVPKGYKLRLTPVPFQYNEDFKTIEGIFNPKFQPQVNILLEYISPKNEILIKQGTPLAVHIPYKKDDIEIETEMYNDKDHSKIRYGNSLFNKGRFHNSYLRNQPHF